MPSADEILNALTILSNKFIFIAILWHIIFVFFLLFLLFDEQKKLSYFATFLLSLSLFSVSFFAWLTGNLFNGMLFLVATVLLVVLSARGKTKQVFYNSKAWLRILGILVFLAGFFYPHFLNDNPWNYLYAAPVGIVPCPTLLTITGFVLMFDLKQSQSWSVVLILLDAFYGLFGVLKLKVFLDFILIVAAIALALQTILIRKQKNQQVDRFMLSPYKS